MTITNGPAKDFPKHSRSRRRVFDDVGAFLVDNGEVVAQGAILENLPRMSEVPAGQGSCGVLWAQGFGHGVTVGAVVRLGLASSAWVQVLQHGSYLDQTIQTITLDRLDRKRVAHVLHLLTEGLNAAPATIFIAQCATAASIAWWVATNGDRRPLTYPPSEP